MKAFLLSLLYTCFVKYSNYANFETINPRKMNDGVKGNMQKSSMADSQSTGNHGTMIPCRRVS